MGTKKINLGIIGIGHLGSIHLKIYSELADKVNLVGICDIKEDRTQRLASHYHVPFSYNYKDLKGRVDAVSICVPTENHFEVAKFFLENKTHVFIEKPFANTVKEAEELIKIAQKNKLKIQVGHVERFNSAFESIKHFAKRPLFIECHRLNKFPNRSLDIGVIMDLMIHDIDIVLALNNNSPVKEIRATGLPVLTPLEDIASVRLTFDNGCVCNLTASRISDDVMRKIRIFQTDSYISLDYVNQEAYIYKKHEQQILKHALPIEKEQPLQKELSHFVDCVLNDQTPYVTGEDGKLALDVALKISKIVWDNHKSTL
jgi:predicted dehydrogenase